MVQHKRRKRNSGVYVLSDSSRRSVLRGEDGKQKENKVWDGCCGVSCLASCLDHWHVCLCPFARNSHVSLFILPNEQSAPLTQGRCGGKTQGRLVLGEGVGGGFSFSFSFVFLQRHSWLLPHWWWLVSVYSRARWPDRLPSPWHQAPWLPALSIRRHNITDSSVSRPSSGLNPRLHQRLGRLSSSFYWSAIVFSSIHKASGWYSRYATNIFLDNFIEPPLL